MTRKTHGLEVRIQDGRVDATILVGRLSGDIAALYRIYKTDVRMDAACYKKIIERHKLSQDHLTLVQKVIDHGWCLKSRSNPNDIEFFYIDTERFGLRFLLVLKLMTKTEEIWVRSFHITDEQQLRSRIRRARSAGLVLRFQTD